MDTPLEDVDGTNARPALRHSVASLREALRNVRRTRQELEAVSTPTRVDLRLQLPKFASKGRIRSGEVVGTSADPALLTEEVEYADECCSKTDGSCGYGGDDCTHERVPSIWFVKANFHSR